jgi:pimeloyl-ACP methyl ester carboxylesterase
VRPEAPRKLHVETDIRKAEAALFRRFGTQPSECTARTHLDGSSLRILSFGNGRPVLCLHAASWFAAHWAPLCALLPGHRFHCVDMPGHGLSGEVNYHGKELRAFQVALFREVAASLGLQNSPIIGNSLGGMTALWLALDAPELVSRLVILGVPATALQGAQPDLILSLLSMPVLNRLVLAIPATTFTSRMAMRGALAASDQVLAPELFEIHALARRRREFALTVASWMAATHVWRGAREGVVISHEELARLRQPTLFIWGERDIFGGPEIAKRAARVMPVARVEILPTGHHPQLTATSQCASLVERFLADTVAPA